MRSMFMCLAVAMVAACSAGTGGSNSGSSSSSSGCAAQDDTCCPVDFCECQCSGSSGFAGKGYRPQCGFQPDYQPGGACVYTDPCISGLDADGGWLVCGL